LEPEPERRRAPPEPDRAGREAPPSAARPGACPRPRASVRPGRIGMEAGQVPARRARDEGCVSLPVTRLSVVISTYERPDALDAVLWALSEQTESDFDVVVADDGSGRETEAVVERWQGELGSRLAHVRQPDEGFRLALVRNRAARAARGDALVFLDGDCVPRQGLVRAVARAARPGWFLGSRRLMLSKSLTARVLGQRLAVHRWTLGRWALRERSEIPSPHALTPR